MENKDQTNSDARQMADAMTHMRMMREIVVDPDTLSRQLPVAIREASPETGAALTEALRPTIAEGLRREVDENRDALVTSLWPVILPAVRMSVRQMMQQMMQSTNQLLENSLSLRGWRWRLEAWRTKRPFAEVAMKNSLIYQVEQAFLIQPDSGLLIRHLADENSSISDPDLVSGMLTAIREFVRDSFDGQDTASLSQFQVGDYTMYIEQAPSSLLALAIRGTPNYECREVMQDALGRLQQDHGEALEAYSGDGNTLPDLDTTLATCLHSEHQTKREKSKALKIAMFAAAAAAALILLLQARSALHQHAVEKELAACHDAPGLLITRTEWDGRTLQVHGSHDPSGFDPAKFPWKKNHTENHLSWNLKRHLSLDPAVVIRRMISELNPPSSVNMMIDGSHLILTGFASASWKQRALDYARRDPGISFVNISELETKE